MLCCGFSTARLRKFVKFRGILFLLFVAFSIVVVMRLGLFFSPAQQNVTKDQEILWQDSSGKDASGSGLNNRRQKVQSKGPLLQNPPSTMKNVVSTVEDNGGRRVEATTETESIETSERSYLDLVDEGNPSHSLDNDKTYPVNKLKKFTQSMNDRLMILNKHKYPNRPKHGPVVVVQVHKRLEYLVYLLSSLEKARGIQDILLIISSDWYSDAIVSAVKKITFCQTLHIFFPFAEQLHPDSYPGSDRNDCPRDMSKEEAQRINCNNAEYPDQYGHYREAKFTMTKHHWWWKANVVLDKLAITRTSRGPFVFLEEDHYVSPDFFHSLNLLHKMKTSDSRCVGSCDVLNLGMYVKAENYLSLSNNQVSLTNWRSYDHNMGMTIYRDAWNAIKSCSKVFCGYDDYNWDWTLMYISLSCLKAPLKVLSIDLPRVFHIGQCGMHHEGQCNTDGIVQTYKDLLENNKDALFVKKFTIANMEDGSAHSGVQNGGWGDKRDHELCLSFVKKP